MRTSELCLGIALNSPPGEVFHALTDSREHSRFTDDTSLIDPVKGGRFSYFGGRVFGTFLEVSKPHRIVQLLQTTGWPEDHVATVEQHLNPQSDGHRTFVQIRERNIPSAHLDGAVAGWSSYWERLSTYLRESRIDLVRRFVEQYKNQHDWDCVDEFISDDCEIHIPLPGLPQGREGMRLNGELVCSAFPDVHVTREFFATEGDLVMERAHAKATHLGPLMSLDATGRPVRWTELHAYRVQEGKITGVWSEPDLMGILAQLGVVDLPGGAPN